MSRTTRNKPGPVGWVKRTRDGGHGRHKGRKNCPLCSMHKKVAWKVLRATGGES
jgi:hypothetical protein